MNKLFAILLTSVALSGCSSLGLSSDPTTTAVVVEPATVKAATPTAAPNLTTAPTVTLIQVLDAAGCDFQVVQTTEGVARKGSATLSIGCK